MTRAGAVSKRRDIKQRRALVTGASSGIGKALAAALARAGARVLMTARSADAITSLERALRDAGQDATACPADVTLPEDRRRVAGLVLERWGGLDLLINNAGVGATGPFRTSDESVLRTIMEVNFFGLVETTRECLPLLAAGQQPMIVNISSVLGRRAIPNCTEYCASKFAVTGFSEALRSELTRDGIDVLVVHAGLTDTSFRDHMIRRGPRRPWQNHRAMTPETVARKTLAAVRRGKHELDLTFEGRWLIRLNKLVPRLVDWVLAKA